jgi:hypothetical protein
MDHAARKINAADEEIPPLPFEEAASFLKSRIPMTKTEWNGFEPKLRFRAFTVARLAEYDYIDAARQVLYKAIETGKGTAETYKQWQTLQTLIQDDAMKLRPGYWENVFRTNTQTAYTAGKLMQFKDSPPPAWRLLIVDDGRTSGICRGLVQEGKQSLAMASGHPFWKTFGFPPYHYQCRTGLQAVFKSEIEGGAVIENPDIEDVGERFKPVKGFGGDPLDKESWWMMTENMAKRAARYGVFNDVENFAKENGHTVYFTPENRKTKNYDAIIDGRLGEFKNLESFKQIRNRLNEADGQRAAIVCLEPPTENQTADDAVKEIRGWFKTSQHPIKYVETVLLIWEGVIIPIKK